jgi:hypothetical protein
MATNPTPLAPFVQAAWESVLPPIGEINKMGTETGEGLTPLNPPFILDAFVPAEKPEYVFVRSSDGTMVCGNAPTLRGQPQPPPTPFLFFLFDRDRVRFLLAKIDRNTSTGQFRLWRLQGSDWVLKWTEPPPRSR